MSRRTYIIIIASIFYLLPVKGQTFRPDISLILENLYARILENNDDKERLKINDSIRLVIDGYVTSDSAFTHRFDNLRYLGQIKSPDSRIKIITWNLPLSEGGNKYYLYILRKGYKGTNNTVYKLTGENREEAARTDVAYSANDWYGALYYAIQPFKINRTTSYVLLGLDTDNTFNSRKIIEVLSFSDSGEVVFGKDCFVKGKETKFREVLEYSSEGIVSLRLNTAKLIVFDHLNAFSSGNDSDSENYGAGLFFDGYIFRKGVWRFISNVDARNKK